MRFSCCIPAKDEYDPKLVELIASIRGQTFPQNEIQIIIETTGDSESAKSTAIKKATGDILCMLCADNLFVYNDTFAIVDEIFKSFKGAVGVYSRHYHYNEHDNSLNRYFSLMGVNDPVPYYLGKADRLPWYKSDKDIAIEFLQFKDKIPSLGDNGFFIKRDAFLKSDLEHYYPMDNCQDIFNKGFCNYIRLNNDYLWHRTSDNLISFLIKRYKYARDLYCDRKDRRWKMLDTNQDLWRLLRFVFSSTAMFPHFVTSIKGFKNVNDFAWFWHPIVCLGFTVTYGILTCRNLALLFRHWAAQNLTGVLNLLKRKPIKTTKSSLSEIEDRSRG